MKVKIKKWDFIIIGLLLIISFLPYTLIKGLISHDADSVYAYITVDGELYGEIPLTGQKDRKEFVIKSKEGENVIVIENETIKVAHADCPDHVCEAFPASGEVGDIIVCLPHQVYIEVKGKSASSNSTEDARAY